jgi:PleD family two-component response regulator
MGGEIHVESELNRGSKFIFTMKLGLQDDRRNIIKEKSKLSLINRNVKLLIAEDEEINYLYFYEIIKSEKFDLIHAQNGKMAVKLFNQSNPDIVLMDK